MRNSQGQAKWIFIGLCAILALIALAWIWRGMALRAQVAEYIPQPPNPVQMPSALGDRIETEYSKALGVFSPVAGLKTLGRLYHANGYYDDAIACYEGLQQIEPENARWYHLHASILTEFGRLEGALPLRIRAAKLAPDYLPAQLRLADTLLKSNRIADAVSAYDGALQLAPDDAHGLLGLARCAIETGDWAKARELLGHAMRIHPDFFGALSLAVTVAEHFGEDELARSLRAKIAPREFSDLPDPWLDGLIADCYDAYRVSVAAAVARTAGDLATARRHLERATALEPEKGTYRRQLAGILTELGETEEAGRELEFAVELAPEDSDSWFQLVQNRIVLGDQEAAARVLKRGLAACPESPSLHLENARYMNSIGRTEDAIKAYREAYRLRPSETLPLVEVASIYFSLGRVDESVTALHEALRKHPEHAIAMTTLALIAIDQGREEEARSWWERVRAQPGAPPQAAATIRRAYESRFMRQLE